MKKFALILCFLQMVFALSGCTPAATQYSHDKSFTDVEESEPYIDDLSDELEIPDNTENKSSSVDKVYQAYTIAANLNKSDLTQRYSIGDFVTWEYQGISITYEDCEFINASYNQDGKVNQGALYRASAESLSRLLDLHRQDTDVKYSEESSMIFGYVSESQDDFVNQAEVVVAFITPDNSLVNILKAFESISCVDGSFDFENNSYVFTISDLSQCAAELTISDEMLGYMIAILEEYPSDIEFDENSCDIDIQIKKYG